MRESRPLWLAALIGAALGSTWWAAVRPDRRPAPAAPTDVDVEVRRRETTVTVPDVDVRMPE